MDEDIKFGIYVTALICVSGWLIGGINALIACVAFCCIPWSYEVREKLHKEPMNLETCVVCGQKYRINDKMTSGERKICHLCINKIFKYTKTNTEIYKSASE